MKGLYYAVRFKSDDRFRLSSGRVANEKEAMKETYGMVGKEMVAVSFTSRWIYLTNKEKDEIINELKKKAGSI